jgi:phospholipase/carboxylesterase
VDSTELTAFNQYAMRIRRAEPPQRLLLLIHGWSGDEDSMWVFVDGLPPDTWVIAPRAPFRAEPYGYSWRPLQPETFGRPSLEALTPAAEGLLALVDSYARSFLLSGHQFDVMGFSQGAALANTLAFLHPERVGKVAILAGFVPAGLEALVPRRPLQGKAFFVGHGTRDEIVSIERAHQSVELLRQAGADVAFCEDDVGHKVSADCRRALVAFLQK